MGMAEVRNARATRIRALEREHRAQARVLSTSRVLEEMESAPIYTDQGLTMARAYLRVLAERHAQAREAEDAWFCGADPAGLARWSQGVHGEAGPLPHVAAALRRAGH